MRFSASLRKTKPVNNHPAGKAAKVNVRQAVLARVPHPSVIDCFAGAGSRYRAVWNAAERYVGCDVRWYRDERVMFACKSERLLRNVDLDAFNIFDLDAYGSPWEHVMIVMNRRTVKPGERVGLCLTEGSNLGLKMGSLPTALVRLCGTPQRMAGAGRFHDELIDTAIWRVATTMRCRVVHQIRAERKGGAAMRYIGLVLEGQAATAADTKSGHSFQ